MSGEFQLREQLLYLVDRIRAARDHRQPDEEYLAEFRQLLPDTDVDNLCDSDYDDETVVDICLGEKETRRPLGSDQLLQLVRDITSKPTETEAESILRVLTFKSNCLHPGGTDLIFYPEEHFGGRSDPTPEEIVEKALNGA